jgi:hypothetical protein
MILRIFRQSDYNEKIGFVFCFKTGLEEIQLTVLNEVFAGVGLCNKF